MTATAAAAEPRAQRQVREWAGRAAGWPVGARAPPFAAAAGTLATLPTGPDRATLEFALQRSPAAFLGGLGDLRLRQTGQLAAEDYKRLVDGDVEAGDGSGASRAGPSPGRPERQKARALGACPWIPLAAC